MKLSAAAVFLTVALVCAPAAHADTNTFLAAARAAGYAQPDDELLRNGYLICASSAQDGVSDDLISRGIGAAQRWLGQDVNEGRDQTFIDLAQTYLCPSETQ
jgi:hypothetical protein